MPHKSTSIIDRRGVDYSDLDPHQSFLAPGAAGIFLAPGIGDLGGSGVGSFTDKPGIDGVDVMPQLPGELSAPPHDALAWRTGGGSS
ncbi:MAG: hypothetical protein ACUVTW_01585 [Thermogutta sp.]